MKRLILLLGLLSINCFGAFTEFYAQTTGSNLNAGSTTADAAVYTGVGDSDGTNIFTPSDGSTPASTVSVGDWASVYVTAGATVATFIGRVTAVAAGVNGAITVSTTAKGGTFPSASAGAHTITCKTGGAWKGPNGTVGFPFGFFVGTMTDASGNIPRVNLKAGTYAVTANVAHNKNGPGFIQGYTTTPGDLGRWTLDGGTGTVYTLFTLSGTNWTIMDTEFYRNGNSGTSGAGGVTTASGGDRSVWQRCLFRNLWQHGFTGSAVAVTMIECEAYNCGNANNGPTGAFELLTTGSLALRCVAHDNGTSGTGSHGFRVDQTIDIKDCISYGNKGAGFYSQADQGLGLTNCDAYNNASDGITLQTASTTLVCRFENCNLIKNGGYGINASGSAVKFGFIYNCGFGSGSQANTSGQTNTMAPVTISGSITYASGVTPWVDPANGDFRINLAAAEGTGRGVFFQTTTTPTNLTVGYPDVGAATHQPSAPQRSFSR